jgi:hypothetical protein
MKLVRIDRPAPSGAPLEFHHRVTVLAGVSPELRRRLVQTFRAFAGPEDPECSGVIEVSGVRLALDRATLDQLRLDPALDPVLSLADDAVSSPPGASSPPLAAQPPVPSPAGQAPPLIPSAEPVSPWVVRAPRDRATLRAELRQVAAERTRLGQRMEETRRGLDSFSRASLDVVRGQIDALEVRRAELRRAWEEANAARVTLRRELLEQIAAARSAVDADRGADPAAVEAARSRLAGLLDVPARPDPVAARLADELAAALEDVLRRSAEHGNAQDRLAEIEQEVVSAREALAGAEQDAGAPLDPAVVRRLEEVRDEIFGGDERGVRLGSSKGKRRIQELRAEEAVLLDRLGFDTYSAYVMGIPSLAKGDSGGQDRVASARDRLARAERSFESARSAATDAPPLEPLLSLLARAESVLGTPTRPGHDLAEPLDLAADVQRIIVRLRAHRVAGSDPNSAEVDDAAAAVAGLLGVDPSVDPPGRARGLVEAADRWLAGSAERAASVARSETVLTRLERQLAELDRAPEPERDVARWASVEADLDAALDRLVDAEDRVRRHEESMDRLADLRAEELVLRERERDLLASLSAEDSASGPSDSEPGTPGPPAPGAPDRFGPSPPPFRGSVPDAPTPSVPGPSAVLSNHVEAARRPEDPHWSFVARLAEQRAVSFAGSVPMLVDGLPRLEGERERLLERMSAMGDLVQLVVISDDPAVRDWAAAQGPAAASVLA